MIPHTNLAGRAMLLAIAVLLALTVEGCTPVHVGAGVAVHVAGPPPPVRAEVVVARPGPRHFWVPGHWRWAAPRRTYVWVGGAWVLPPRPRAVWVAPRYERRGGGWVYIAGRWR